MGPIMTEIWKDVFGWEGYYQVSHTGEVRSLDREIVYPNGSIRKQKGKVLSQGINNYGYAQVVFSKNQKKQNKRVNRLVAETFHSLKRGCFEVNHKDGNKLNNHINNLEWCSSTENNRHALKTGLRSMKTGKLISPSKQVFYVTNVKEFSMLNNLNSRHVYDIINGERLSHKGWQAL